MTYLPFFYAVGISLTYIASRHVFGPRVPQLHHIHDVLFSIVISYSAILDFESYVGSGAFLDNRGGATYVYVRAFRLVIPTIFTVYALYKLVWERTLIHQYDRLKYIVGLTTVACFYMTRADEAALALLLYTAYGHIHVLDAVNRYSHAAGIIEPYTYLRFRAHMYMWILLPIIWAHVWVAVMTYASNAYVCALFVQYILYAIFETYVAVLDYGYNRALLRIGDRQQVDVENTL